jgi:hypothetical protein
VFLIFLLFHRIIGISLAESCNLEINLHARSNFNKKKTLRRLISAITSPCTDLIYESALLNNGRIFNSEYLGTIRTRQKGNILCPQKLRAV